MDLESKSTIDEAIDRAQAVIRIDVAQFQATAASIDSTLSAKADAIVAQLQQFNASVARLATVAESLAAGIHINNEVRFGK